MIDIVLHFVVSYFLVFILVSSTRNMAFSLAVALLIGVSKEIFFDSSISLMDLSANLAGIAMVATSLKPYVSRRL